MKTTKETNKHKYDTTNKSPPNATCHRKSFDGGRRPETGDIFGELCRKRVRHLKSLSVRKANNIKMQDMNTGADKFGVIGNYVDTTGKTFKKSQSIEPPKRRQEGKSADYGFCPVYDSNVCISRQM